MRGISICVSLETKGNVKMPELVETIRSVVLSPGVRAMYNSMEREAVLPLAGATIDAGSAAAVNGKLLQIAGGAIYDEDHQPHELHTEKLDALEDILEEANGEPVLLTYRYQHERDRIMARFPQAVQLKDSETIAAWNAGEIPLLLLHPGGSRAWSKPAGRRAYRCVVWADLRPGVVGTDYRPIVSSGPETYHERHRSGG